MPIVRDYEGGDDELVAATWYQNTQSRFMLAANVDQPLGVPGFVVSGHYAHGADAWKTESVHAGSVSTPYAVAGGKVRTYVAAAGLDQGDTQHLVRAYASTTGAAYWQERLDAEDTFYASLVAADRTTEERVYVAGCRVNDEGGCSISVRRLQGSK